MNAKITDFGLAREVENYYKMPTPKGRSLPLRFLAPESLNSFKFLKESDVWMFGCLCWEIITGTQPYNSIADHITAANSVKSGSSLRNEWELYKRVIPKGLIELLKQCHEHEPSKRPSFTQIKKQLPQCF